MKITIIGNCASGKSSLARKISEILNIPYLQLDDLWFGAGGHKWKKGDVEGIEKIRSYTREHVEKFIRQESWVSDGWYKRVQLLITEKADQIIFLDIPLWKRLLNHLIRMFFSKRHKGLSKWDDFKFIFEIIHRTSTHGVDMKKFVDENKNKAIILRSHKAADRYLTSLK